MPPGPQKNAPVTTIRRFLKIMELIKQGQPLEAYQDFWELASNWKASRQALEQNINRAADVFNSAGLTKPEAKLARQLVALYKPEERITFLIAAAQNGPHLRASQRLLARLLSASDEK